METLLFGAMGWCGTRYPGWWHHGPHRGTVELPQDPIPVKILDLFSGVLAIAAGIGASHLFKTALPGEGLAAYSLIAFAGGRVISDAAMAINHLVTKK